MQIVDFGLFLRSDGTDGIMYFTNEQGDDWYAMLRGEIDGTPKLVELTPTGGFVSAVHPLWAAVNADGIVTNVETDPSRIVPDNKRVLGIQPGEGQEVAAGMLYQDGDIATRPEPTPEQRRAKAPAVTRRQLRLTLVRNGISLETIAATIDQMPAGAERDEARIEWQDGTMYERLHPTLLAIADALALTPEQVDQMWEEALVA